MTRRKGIILAGGTGSRLFPLTHSVSKQLLPVYDKPMIYYPLALLIEAGVREIALITNPSQRPDFERCLGDGRKFGVHISYISQPSPDGLAQAYILAESFLDGSPSAMVLGDNIFWGPEMTAQIRSASKKYDQCTVFGYSVEDPRHYGIVQFDKERQPIEIIEKPEIPPSNCAVTGLYFLDESAPRRAKSVRPSSRGELEITDLLQTYLDDRELTVCRLGAGRWFDTGSPENLFEASAFIQNQAAHHGRIIGSPELAALGRGWISSDELARSAGALRRTTYGQTLRTIASHRVHETDALLPAIA